MQCLSCLSYLLVLLCPSTVLAAGFCFVLFLVLQLKNLTSLEFKSYSTLALSQQFLLRWQSLGTEASFPNTAVAQLDHVFISREIWGEAKLITGLK